jgi:hypothetical protein
MIVLNVVGAGFMFGFRPRTTFTDHYVDMMWKVGPLAMGMASGLFLFLLRWVVGLTRLRLVVFEDAPMPGGKQGVGFTPEVEQAARTRFNPDSGRPDAKTIRQADDRLHPDGDD